MFEWEQSNRNQSSYAISNSFDDLLVKQLSDTSGVNLSGTK